MAGECWGDILKAMGRATDSMRAEREAERKAKLEILKGLAGLDEVLDEANDVVRSARIDETCETILDEILRDSTGER